MSDSSQGDGWWQASDGKWYPPESAPTATQPEPGRSQSRLPDGVRLSSPWIRLAAYLLEGILIVVTLIVGWLIWAALIGGTGQTPAKRMLSLRVIGANTLAPVGLGRMFWVRGILAPIVAFFAILFTLGILLFMPFWDRRNQNIWDKVSNCYVVVDPNDAWGAKPDLRT
ncbi:MAG: RDD family protein [Acidimicrobiia bacterium]